MKKVTYKPAGTNVEFQIINSDVRGTIETNEIDWDSLWEHAKFKRKEYSYYLAKSPMWADYDVMDEKEKAHYEGIFSDMPSLRDGKTGKDFILEMHGGYRGYLLLPRLWIHDKTDDGILGWVPAYWGLNYFEYDKQLGWMLGYDTSHCGSHKLPVRTVEWHHEQMKVILKSVKMAQKVELIYRFGTWFATRYSKHEKAKAVGMWLRCWAIEKVQGDVDAQPSLKKMLNFILSDVLPKK